jgi:hypothetical protein
VTGLALLALPALLAAALPPGVPPDAAVRFLEVTGDAAVHVRFEKKPSVDLQGVAELSFADGILRVSAPAQADGPRPAVTLAVEALTSITTRGTAAVDVQEITGKLVEVHAHGASMITLAGRTSIVVVHGKDTARVDATGLHASSAEVFLSDAARAEVRASFSTTCELERASRLIVKGRPPQVKQKVTGVARLVVE